MKVWEVTVRVHDGHYDHTFYLPASKVDVRELQDGNLRLYVFPYSGMPIALTFSGIMGLEVRERP